MLKKNKNRNRKNGTSQQFVFLLYLSQGYNTNYKKKEEVVDGWSMERWLGENRRLNMVDLCSYSKTVIITVLFFFCTRDFYFFKYSECSTFSSSQPLSLIICTSSIIYFPSLYFWLDSNACSWKRKNLVK